MAPPREARSSWGSPLRARTPTRQNFAPCIVSQKGDGNGGSFTLGLAAGWRPAPPHLISRPDAA